MSSLIVELPSGNKQKIELIRKDDLKTIRDLRSKVITPDFKLNTSLTQSYYFSCIEGDGCNWLTDDVLIDRLELDDNEFIRIFKRFTLIEVSLALGATRYTQLLTIDLEAPLKDFVPFAAKKFQLEDYNAFALFLDANILDPSKSLIELDILPDQGEFIISRADSQIVSVQAVDIIEKRCSMQRYNAKKKKYEDVAIVLMDNVLHVYKDEETPENHIISIILPEHNIEIKEKKKEYAFELERIDNAKEVEVLKCESKEELDEWFALLSSLTYVPNDNDTPRVMIFGGKLENAVKEGDVIPSIITETIEHVRSRALQVEGIFRLSGSMTKIEEYIRLYNKGIDVNLDDEEDPHTVAGLLKLYLGKLEEPLFPYDYYDTFIQVQLTNNETERKRNLRYLIQEFPEVHKEVAKYLFQFLGEVESFADVNMMALHNIATVFAPNILQPRDKSNPLQMVQDTPLINGLIFSCIRDFDYIFADEDPEGGELAEAAFDYVKAADNQISLTAGEEVKVIQQRENGWWFGEKTETGEQGLFPATYVKIIPSNLSRKRKFLKKLRKLKTEVQTVDRKISELEEEKQKLNEDLAILNSPTSSSDYLADQLLHVIGANKKLKSFAPKLEGYYVKLETQTQYRTALTIKKQELLHSLQELKKSLNTDKKLKKQKDKIDLIDGLRGVFEEEQRARQSADEAKERILKDFIELKKILSERE